MASVNKRPSSGTQPRPQPPARPLTAGSRPRPQPDNRSPPAGTKFRAVPRLAAPPLRSKTSDAMSSDGMRVFEDRFRQLERQNKDNSSKVRNTVDRLMPRLQMHARDADSKVRMVKQMRQAMSDGFLTRAPPLGFDTLYAPKRGMAFYRGQALCNTDGSLTITANPNFANFIGINNTAFTATTGLTMSTLFSPATNKAGDSLEVASARPLSLTLRTWADIAATSIPGRNVSGCVNFSGGDVTYPAATSFDTQGAPTAGSATPSTFYPYAQYTSVTTTGGAIAQGSSTCLFTPTSTLFNLPSLTEQVGFRPVTASWKPAELDQVDFDGSFAGELPVTIIEPLRTYINTNNVGSVGTATGNTLVSQPILGYKGPFVVSAYANMPTNAIIFIEAFYEFEYLSDTLMSSPSPSMSSGTTAATLFPSKEAFYREVLSEEAPRPEPAQEKEGFFGSLAKSISSFVSSPIGSLVIDGISMLFGAQNPGDHQVYRVGGAFLLKTEAGNRFLRPLEIEAYLQEKAVNSYKISLSRDEEKQAAASAPPPTRSSSITPSESDALEDFHAFERARRKHDELSRSKVINK